MNTLILANVGKAPLTVRLIKEGDRYGSDGCLIHEGVKPMVEFYDRRYHLDKWLEPDIKGQFVARYYVDTIMGHKGGLTLDMGVPSWYLNDVKPVQDWIKRELGL